MDDKAFCGYQDDVDALMDALTIDSCACQALKTRKSI